MAEYGNDDKIYLKLNSVEINMKRMFKGLREKEEFSDVTLVCEDDQVQAHKIILSAGSSFFHSLFRRNPHQHPLLYLKGVKYDQIVSVLNFMYCGEVSVPQEKLATFLAIAKDLKVNGLSQNNLNQEFPCKESEKCTTNLQLRAVDDDDEAQIDDDKADNDEDAADFDFKINEDEVVGHVLEHQVKTEMPLFDPLTEAESEIAVKDDDEAAPDNFDYEGGSYQEKRKDKRCMCEKCGKGFKDSTHLRKHRDVLHSAAYACVRCGDIFPDKSAGLAHQRGCHFTCPFPECGAEFIHKGNFEKHQRGHLANIRRSNKL